MSSQPANEKLIVNLENGIKRITFNQPERRNAIDFDMFERFATAVEDSSSDGTRVIVISGAGDSFCSGLDLSSLSLAEFAQLDIAAKIRELIHPPISRLRALSVPVIARIHGAAAGIGFSYVLASDLRIASSDATFGQSFVRIGLMPDGGSTFFLPRIVGYAKAFELMASGAALDAAEALNLGLLNKVVPFEQLDATVDQLATHLSRSPQPAIARIKEALSSADSAALDAALDFEAEGQAACFRSADFLEGVTAFRQKRAPVFGKRNENA